MITASIVLYKTKEQDLKTILNCAIESSVHFIYVIDNSPNDTARGLIESYGSDKLVYIYGQGNIGYGKAHNIGILKAMEDGAKYHVVLNPDIRFDPGTIEALADYMDRHPDIGQILPRVIYPNGEIQYLCKLLPTPIDMFGRRLLPKRVIEKRNARYEMRWSGYDRVRNCPTLSGCFMFFKVAVLRQVGLFDGRFFMYFEDNDLTRRIHQVSKTVYYPKVTIVHNHAAEHRHSKSLLKEGVKSAVLYFNKWGWLFDRERRRVNRDAFDDRNIIE